MDGILGFYICYSLITFKHIASISKRYALLNPGNFACLLKLTRFPSHYVCFDAYRKSSCEFTQDLSALRSSSCAFLKFVHSSMTPALVSTVMRMPLRDPTHSILLILCKQDAWSTETHKRAFLSQNRQTWLYAHWNDLCVRRWHFYIFACQSMTTQ